MLFSGNLSIYSQLLNETELPRQGEDSVIESQVRLVAKFITNHRIRTLNSGRSRYVAAAGQ